MKDANSRRTLDVKEVARELDEFASFLKNDFDKIVLAETDSLQDGISMLNERPRLREVDNSEDVAA